MSFVLVACSAPAEVAEAQEMTSEASETETKVTEENTKEENETQKPENKTFKFMMAGEEKEITVPYEPQKIVVIGYDLIDIVDALGHQDKIVGVPDPKNPMFPSFLEGYENVTSVGSLFGDDLEAVAGLQPDLILAGARTAAAYDALSEIAPTAYFTIPGMGGSGFEDKLVSNINDVAYLLDSEEESEVVIETLTEKIHAVQSVIEDVDAPNAMFLTAIGKSISVFTDNPESRYAFVYKELGFDAVAGVEEVAEEDKRVNNGESSRHGNSVSFEFISSKNPNYILVLDLGTTTGRSDIPVSDTLNNPLVGSTQAGKNDQIIYLDGTSWYLATGGIEASTIMMDELIEAFGK